MDFPLGRKAFFAIFFAVLSAALLVIFGKPVSALVYGAEFSLPELPVPEILSGEDEWLRKTNH